MNLEYSFLDFLRGSFLSLLESPPLESLCTFYRNERNSSHEVGRERSWDHDRRDRGLQRYGDSNILKK